tara:strand:+ start:1090 stop:1239 length:150 start_codon:yes stop_codon:yes gene_type:complete
MGHLQQSGDSDWRPKGIDIRFQYPDDASTYSEAVSHQLTLEYHASDGGG